MFVDLDWPLNTSSLLSASAELLVCWCGVFLVNINSQYKLLNYFKKQPCFAPCKPGFNSCWYPQESLVTAGRTSSQHFSRVPMRVRLPSLVGSSEPLNNGVNDLKFGDLFWKFHYFVCLMSLKTAWAVRADNIRVFFLKIHQNTTYCYYALTV